MGLRFDPMGGGQFKQAVKAMVEAERQPIKTLETRKSREEARMKLFQEFKNKFSGFEKTLAEFSDFKKFRELKVDLGDGASQVAVTLDKEKAQTGTYQMKVEQLAGRSSMISNGFSSPDEPNLGIGFVVVNTPDGESHEVFVEGQDSSLRGIANLINRQKDSPVQASVVKDLSDSEKPWRLIMSAKKDGLTHEVEFPDFYFMDGDEDFYISEQKSAANAYLTLDGFELESESNNITDFLEGVNLQLKQAKEDSPFTMTITEDFQKVSAKVKGLVDQINGILEFINKQNQVDEKSDTKTTFTGDTGLQSVEYRIRNVMHEGFPVWDNTDDSEDYRLVFLNQIGIEFEKNGSVSFKEEKFQKALQKDFEGISEAITGEHGFGAQLKQIIAGYTRQGQGLLSTREQGLRNRIRRLDDEIAAKERRLEQRTQAITDRFSRLQSTLSELQQQQQYLASAMPGAGGGNILSQLMGSG